MNHEIHKFEIFDAYDENEQKLNIDMIRGEAHPDGLYHIVVEVITVNEHNEILITKRDPCKNFPLLWEVTGGSVLKGETTLEGATRELKEETGLIFNPDTCKLVYKETEMDALFRGYIHFQHTDNMSITLQEKETVDYEWVPICSFIERIHEDNFVINTRRRILHAWQEIEPLLFKNEFYQ